MSLRGLRFLCLVCLLGVVSGCVTKPKNWDRSPYYHSSAPYYKSTKSANALKEEPVKADAAREAAASPSTNASQGVEGQASAPVIKASSDVPQVKRSIFNPFRSKTRTAVAGKAVEPKVVEAEVVAKPEPAAERTSFFSAFTRRPVTSKEVKNPAATPEIVSKEVKEPAPDAAPVSVASFVVSNKAQVVYLRPGLTLNVSVLVAGKKEIEEKMRRISDNGVLDLPLLGALTVKGLPASDLSGYLAGLYKQYYVDPQVIVDFAQEDKLDGVSPWGFVTVLGRVKTPGRIPIPPTQDITVSGSIQKAGGFDTSANLKAIKVTRRAIDGKTETREVDLHAVGSKGKLKEDITLRAEDVVYVPEQMF